MHPAVETILSRMKSHPDEFVNNGKWTQAIGDYKKWFTKEELDAVNEGLRGLRMAQFQERIFKILTTDEVDEAIDLDPYGRITGFGNAPMKQSGQPISYTNGLSLTALGTGTASTLNGGTGATTLSLSSAYQQQLDAFKEELRRVNEEQQRDLGTDLFKELSDDNASLKY